MNRAFCPGLWVFAMLVSGCIVEAAASTGVSVSGPPPDPMQEPHPPFNRPSAVWIPGYWHWAGLQYTWIPGHWEEAPTGARWRPPRYLLRDGVYYYEPGGWWVPSR
jgi:WXXGXW repeat (2 copies)